MYRALYRKYRPQTFADVVGQEAITTALQNQIIAGKVGHAFLFTGTRGTGKTTCAKIFAKAVNCEQRNGANPCGECVPCKGLEDGSILDVIEIDAASNNGVDDIRDLRDETAYRPSRCSYKVYIIDEVHMLSTAAFNALLKIMEEPPSHVIFILATTEIHKVPATILSRCQRYDFVRIPAEKIAVRLLDVAGREGISLTSDAADLIARLADGALRDALSLLDTCAGAGEQVDEALVRRMAGVTDKGYLFEVSEAVAAGDPQALLALVAGLREKSIDVKRLCEELVHHYRNCMLAAAKPDGSLLQSLPAEERAKYAAASGTVSGGFAIAAVRRLAEAMDKMGRSPDPRIELELALFDLSTGPAPAPVMNMAAQPHTQTSPAPKPVVAATPSAVPVQQPDPAAPVQPAEPAAQPVAAPTSPPAVEPPVTPAPPVQEQASPAPATIPEPPPADEAPPWEEAPPSSVEGEPPFAMESEVPAPEPSASHREQAVPDTFTATAATGEPVLAPPAATEMAVPQAIEQEPVQAPAAQPVPQASAAEAPFPGTPPLFAHWQQVVAGMAPVDRMLYSYMRDSTAYLDGNRVLIDGGDMFLSYMREYEGAADKIKAAIEQASGKRYAIGPYTGPAKAEKKQVTARDTLEDWQKKGVEVEIIKE